MSDFNPPENIRQLIKRDSATEHVSYLLAEIEALQTELTESERLCKQAEERLGALEERCLDRTLALQQAIGMAQDGVQPNLSVINRWRGYLGWH